MAVPIPTRFSDAEIEILDWLVAAGIGDTRSPVVRRAVHDLADVTSSAAVGRAIAESYRSQPQDPDDAAAMAAANALTAAEPW